MVKEIKTGTSQLIVEEVKQIVTITLNNPKYKNALSEDLTPYLRKILKKISKDSKYKLLIIRGQGNSFCSGGNVKKMLTNDRYESISVKSKVNSLIKKQIELTYLISSLKIPTIAVVTGAAAGAGFSLALSCDIRIGNSNAFFLSNYSKIGLSGDYGISWYLVKILGVSKAKEIMFFNQRIYSKKAYELGILNYLIDKNFDLELDKIINNIVSQPISALKLIKMNINFASNNSLTKSLELEAKNLIKSSMSEEHRKAILKFKKG